MKNKRRKLTITEIINEVADNYPDQAPLLYWDQEEGVKVKGSGDLLAEFIVTEISETDNPALEDKERLTDAIRHLTTAREWLNGVIFGLEMLRNKV